MLEPGSVTVGESTLVGDDPYSGATIWQMTSGVAIHHQIYGEVPYTDPSSRWLVYVKQRDTYGPVEVWRADLVRRWVTPVCDGVVGTRGMAVSPDQRWFYCVRGDEDDTFELVRTEIATLEQTSWTFTGPPFVRCLGSASPDGDTYVTGTELEPGRYGIVRFDLSDGSREVIHEGPEIFNAHPQIEPGEGRLVLVQNNRGGEFDAQGRVLRSVGEIGANLYLIDIDGGNYQELPVGRPYTYPVQGHQCWIGTTGQILLTDGPPVEEAVEKGNLFAVAPGDEAARVVATGHCYCHPNASRDGRFFASDTRPGHLIVVGSLRTGRFRTLCHTRTSFGAPQFTHPHPYLTPDNAWVIYNSDRTGIPHVHAARVPEGLLEELDS